MLVFNNQNIQTDEMHINTYFLISLQEDELHFPESSVTWRQGQVSTNINHSVLKRNCNAAAFRSRNLVGVFLRIAIKQVKARS